MRVWTALENWRTVEKRLSAIDKRIAGLRDAKKLSAEQASALAKLIRAREEASKLADKCWALHLENLKGKD